MTTIMAILAMSLTHAADAPQAKEPNCFITVTSVFKTGEKKERIYKLHEKSEAECKSAAKIHETNFAPQAIKKKTVKHRWIKG